MRVDRDLRGRLRRSCFGPGFVDRDGKSWKRCLSCFIVVGGFGPQPKGWSNLACPPIPHQNTQREKKKMLWKGGERLKDWLYVEAMAGYYCALDWTNTLCPVQRYLIGPFVSSSSGPNSCEYPHPHPHPPHPTHNQQWAVLQGSGGNQEGSAGHLNKGLWENECQRQGESDRKQTLAWDSTSALQRPSSEADWNQHQRGVFQRPLRRGLFSERVCQDGRWQMGEGGAGTFLSSANYLFTSWFHWGPTEENNTYI